MSDDPYVPLPYDRVYPPQQSPEPERKDPRMSFREALYDRVYPPQQSPEPERKEPRMSFREALDNLLNEYQDEPHWKARLQVLRAAVEAHVWGPHPEPAERVVEPAPALPALPVPEDTVSQFVADPVHEEPANSEPDPLGGPGPSTDHKVF